MSARETMGSLRPATVALARFVAAAWLLLPGAAAAAPKSGPQQTQIAVLTCEETEHPADVLVLGGGSSLFSGWRIVGRDLRDVGSQQVGEIEGAPLRVDSLAAPTGSFVLDPVDPREWQCLALLAELLASHGFALESVHSFQRARFEEETPSGSGQYTRNGGLNAVYRLSREVEAGGRRDLAEARSFRRGHRRQLSDVGGRRIEPERAGGAAAKRRSELPLNARLRRRSARSRDLRAGRS
jgi:hypothetical protein